MPLIWGQAGGSGIIYVGGDGGAVEAGAVEVKEHTRGCCLTKAG